ncbi:MAG: hypothetical protein GYB65_19435 [Chloroflexi bacterium]|nr:hypothetical protein [Chloroflexota bacterium]
MANKAGGGIANGGTPTDYVILGGSVTITNSMFANNMAQSYGGGFHNAYEGTATITNSTFAYNLAGRGGGAIYNGVYSGDDAGSSVQVNNSTITANVAAQPGGGIYNAEGSTVTLSNSVVAFNTSGDCAADDAVMTNWDGSTNLDSDGTCPDSAPMTGLDEQPGRNGGPTFTYALLDGSSATNAGDPTLCPSTDQRGAVRSAPCDIGAFEYGAELPGD